MNENVSFTDHTSGIRLPDSFNLVINRKNDNDVTRCQHDIIVSSSNFFDVAVFLLKLSCWFKFHVNIITGMTISLYKGLTGNPEIGNTSVWVFPSIWRLGRVRDTKFGTNVSNKMLLNTSKCQSYSFYRFWVI